MRSYRYFLVTAFVLGAVYSASAADRNLVNRVLDASAPPAGLRLSKLLTITSDRNSNVDDLEIALDQAGVPQGMEVILEGQSDAAPLYFSLADITSDAGAVLNQTQGYNTLILKGALDPSATSSTLTLSYLSNGLWGDYTDCQVIVNAPSDATPAWSVENAYTHTAVSGIQVITSSFGVKTVQGICPDASN